MVAYRQITFYLTVLYRSVLFDSIVLLKNRSVLLNQSYFNRAVMQDEKVNVVQGANIKNVLCYANKC